MKKLMLAAIFAVGSAIGIEAAPTDNVTQADLQAIIERLNKLEAENKAQAKKIADLEGKNKALVAKAEAAEKKADAKVAKDEGTAVNESGKIYTTANGHKYYLADASARIFEPLTESGLKFQPYGYLVLEGIYNTAGTDSPMYTDYVRPRNAQNHGGKDHTATLSICDSILGFNIFTPETYAGWKFNGKFEFDLAGGNINDWGSFHIRHLYWNMEHEDGWSILFGQTWHLWKMVTPSEIDGAWMEFTGHPYRRSPQIRVTKKWDWEDSSLEARVGFVKGGPGMSGDRDGNGTEDNEQTAWGLFEGALVYEHDASWDDGRRWLFGIGGHYGRTNIHRCSGYDGNGDPIFDGPDDNYNSSMIMLAASIPFAEKFTLCGQVFAGENLGDVQGGVGNKIAFKDPMNKGREITTVGGFIDLNYALNDTWSFAAGYGFDNPSVHADEDIYTRGWSGATFNDRVYVDAFYQWNANLHFGLEYAYLTTQYVGFWEDNDSHRFQFSVYYDF